jgi:hypothetical protein
MGVTRAGIEPLNMGASGFELCVDDSGEAYRGQENVRRGAPRET